MFRLLEVRGSFPPALVLLAVLCCGCARQPAEALRTASAPPVWPPPPEAARIQYLYSITRPADIGSATSLLGKVARAITGARIAPQVVRPYGMCLAPGDILYVADPGIQAVHRFDLKERRYDQIKKFGKQKFLSPIGVTMDSTGRLFISDSLLRTIFVYSAQGEPEEQIGTEDQLLRPTGIAIHPLLERLYVVDTSGHSIQVFDLAGTFLFTIGGRGTGEGAFNFPTAISIDSEGILYVNDSLNYRVQAFDADGRFLYLFGRQGDGMGEFSHPKGIALDSKGHLYVTDAIFDAVQIFDREGTLLLSFGEAGQDPGHFWMPSSIHIDATDRIFVADSYNQRIQVFRFLGGEGR